MAGELLKLTASGNVQDFHLIPFSSVLFAEGGKEDRTSFSDKAKVIFLTDPNNFAFLYPGAISGAPLAGDRAGLPAAALPHGLIEEHTGSHRHIEGIQITYHGQTNSLIRKATGFFANPLVLRP